MTSSITIPDEAVLNTIYLIRGQKVMLDKDLAELYEVETKVLKQAVKRNMDIFPGHFMFELNSPGICLMYLPNRVCCSWLT